MPDHDEAVATALDAYQHQLLPDDLPSHRADPLLAELLSKSLIGQLARYADRRDLDVHDTVALLHQERLDRDGRGTDAAHDFRLGSEVQFRQQRTTTGAKPRFPLWRGFITALAGSPGGEAQCTVRVPGINQGLHVTASELEPAESMPPLPTSTAGVVTSAHDAESTIIDIAARLKRAANNGLATDELALTDLTQLTVRLASWSGGQPHAIVRQFRDRVTDAARKPAQEHDSAARLSATEFPQGPTPDPSDVPPPSAEPKPDDQQKPHKRRP
jgi:hypothetical protein